MNVFAEFLLFIAKVMVIHLFVCATASYIISKYFEIQLENVVGIMDGFLKKVKEDKKEKENG